MSTFAKFLLLAVLLVSVRTPYAHAASKTVCTITVNSSDERQIFRRYLPEDEFEFVELVEHGRPDWLESACRKGVRCDVLLISGHFDDGTQFYSDQLDTREFLPVEEMQRISCSDSCPGLFSHLQEVHLFGCNTLNAEPLRSTSAEIARSLVRSGHSPADAERLSRLLNDRHGDSNRERMRQIFKDVPVIYGFSSKAPLGPTAASILDRYFRSGARAEIGSGRASAKLLSLFAPVSMTVTAGVGAVDAQASYRQDVCEFSDDRSSPAQKLKFLHRLLDREMAEVRMFLDHIEKVAFSLTDAGRQTGSESRVLEEIARDQAARGRFLEFARDADERTVRVRMLDVANRLGWLSPSEHRSELVAMLNRQLAADAVSSIEVDLACALDRERELGRELYRLQVPPAQASKVTHAAILACLGSADGRARVLRALTSSRDDDVEIAQLYLSHRPISDVHELRAIAAEIAHMSGSDAQVRALDTLARLRLTDGESLQELTRLFPRARSVHVQRAIAGVLIRADYAALPKHDLVRTLRQHRLKSPDGEDVIDVLIRRLQLG